MRRSTPLLSVVFALGVAADAGAPLPSAALNGPLRSGLLTDFLAGDSSTSRLQADGIRQDGPALTRSAQFVPFSNSAGFRNCIVNQFRSC